MLKAEREINADLEGALAYVRPHYPGFSTEEVVAGPRNQPPCTDIRRFIPLMLGRWQSLRELRLAPASIPVPRHALQLDRFAHLFEGRKQESWPTLCPAP
jgi:hypothetical protein